MESFEKYPAISHQDMNNVQLPRSFLATPGSRSSSVRRPHEFENDVLQDIGDSGANRRCRQHSLDADPTRTHRMVDRRHFKSMANSPSPAGSYEARFHTLPPVSSIERPPPKLDYRTNRRGSSHTAAPQKSSADTTRYIEHLESSLAASQTRLQSASSPTNSRLSGARMKAMHSEIESLRHTIVEWETSFEDRIKNTIEQYGAAETSLQARVGALESDKDSLTAELHNCTAKLHASETANSELERRVDFLSELVAKSPGKIDLEIGSKPSQLAGRRLHSRAPSQEQSQISPVARIPVSNAQKPRLFPILTDFSSTSRSHSSSPVRPRTLDERVFQRLESGRHSAGPSIDKNSATSSTFIEGREDPSRRSSWIEQVNLGHIPPRSRPSRRMRRFYTGSTGPRSLLLPGTAGTETDFNTASLSPAKHSPEAYGSQSDTVIGLEEEPFASHRRSSTIDTVGAISPGYRHLRTRLASFSTSDGSNWESLRTPKEQRHLSSRRAIRFRAPLEDTVDQNRSRDLSRIDDTKHGFNGLTEPLRSLTAPNRLNLDPLLPSLPDVGNQSSMKSTAFEFDQSQSALAKVFPSLDRVSDRPASTAPQRPAVRSSSRLFLEAPGQLCTPQVFRVIPRFWELVDHLSHSIDTHNHRVRRLLDTTWCRVWLSQPVLEFRWWLICLLLRHLNEKGLLLCRRLRGTGQGLGLSFAGSAVEPRALHDDAMDAYGSVEAVAAVDRRFQKKLLRKTPYSAPSPPPVSWLRFSMTMVCAVGIAIKDGPDSLFETSDSEDGDSKGYVDDIGSPGGALQH